AAFQYFFSSPPFLQKVGRKRVEERRRREKVLERSLRFGTVEGRKGGEKSDDWNTAPVRGLSHDWRPQIDDPEVLLQAVTHEAHSGVDEEAQLKEQISKPWVLLMDIFRLRGIHTCRRSSTLVSKNSASFTLFTSQLITSTSGRQRMLRVCTWRSEERQTLSWVRMKRFQLWTRRPSLAFPVCSSESARIRPRADASGIVQHVEEEAQLTGQAELLLAQVILHQAADGLQEIQHLDQSKSSRPSLEYFMVTWTTH
ncbi:hypothetical protein JZ751_009290, partial [Albula glossodonta]